jgi:hypothetical protein
MFSSLFRFASLHLAARSTSGAAFRRVPSPAIHALRSRYSCTFAASSGILAKLPHPATSLALIVMHVDSAPANFVVVRIRFCLTPYFRRTAFAG